MRIAYLSTFYPFRGGIAQFNASVYRELEKAGNQTQAFTFTTQYPQFLFPGQTQFVQKDDIVEIIDAKRVLNSANPFNWRNAAKKIKKTSPDLLIMKYWMSYFGPSLGYVAGKMNKDTKIITILDNVIPHEKKIIDTAFTKYFLKKNHGFIAMSEKVKNDLLKFLPNAKVELIPHPLYNHFGEIINKDIARLQLGLDPNKKTLLFFGFIRDYKGLDLLIESFGKLDKSYQLVIAGEVYGDFGKYDELINKNTNKENIFKHVKYISDKEVSSYFSASDLCILPYKSATQSGITGISFHFEVPMIAINVGGLAEIISHEKTGLIVPEVKVDSITNNINSYFQNYKQEDFINNIKILKQELSWKVFTQKLLEFSKNL